MEKKYTLKDSWEQSLNWDEETDSESALNKAMLLSITDTEHLSMFDDDSLYDLSIIPTGSQMENKSYSFESTESTSRLSMFKGDVEHRRNDEEFSNKIEKRNTMWQNLPELKDALESFSFNNTANSPSTSSELSSAFTSTIFSKEKLITIFEGTNESTSTSCLPDWSAECLVRMIRAIKKA
ncbi:hypothetical protein KM043_013398 [Ampulex compressa]|nr:hypothetical protein KM043_013398 [Ampulex compressa]